MLGWSFFRRKIDEFIFDEIDSIPHLEALLLLWNSRPKQWHMHEIAKELYIPVDHAQRVLQDLEQHELITVKHHQYSYYSDCNQDELIKEVDRGYRQELIRISNLIHSKALLIEQKFGT